MNVLTGNTEIVFRASVFGALAMAMVVSNVAHADGLVKDSEPKALEDPLEGVNRVTSDVNRGLREAIIDPVVDGYQAVTPDPIQQSISNIFSNLSEPVTAISSLLQGDTENAGTATNRFIINTTVGLGGVNDEATDMSVASSFTPPKPTVVLIINRLVAVPAFSVSPCSSELIAVTGSERFENIFEIDCWIGSGVTA